MSIGSPCIDASDSLPLPGDVTLDLAVTIRRLDDPCVFDTGTGSPTYVDMGGYEFNHCVGINDPHCDPQVPTDCDGNLEIDICEILSDPAMFDADSDGVLDDCQPEIVHGDPDNATSFESWAFTGYIDPRAESNDGVNIDMGLDEITIVFSEDVYGDDGAPGVLFPIDFVISATGSTTPSITTVSSVDNKTFVLTLNDILPLQEWVTIEANVWSVAFDLQILDLGNGGPGATEPDRIDVAFLPSDVDQNGDCSPFDLLQLRFYLEQGATPPQGIAEDFADIQRNGGLTPLDMTRYRQLVTGVSPSTRIWDNESMNNTQP